MREIEEEQLKIYYYFMMADGKCTSEELNKFELICKEMGVQQDDMLRIARECELAVDISGKNGSARVKAVIQALLEDDGSPFEKEDNSKRCHLTRNKQRQIYVIWNLINLGYADQEYSSEEKSIVEFLVDFWEIDDKLLAEMFDVAETLLELIKQREWIKTTSKPYDLIHKIVEETDRDIEKLKVSMERTLEEACEEV